MNYTTIYFIVNGSKKASQRIIPEITNTFAAYPISVQLTNYSGHAAMLAEEAVQSGALVIISVGGDGTLNEVINGIMKGCAKSGLDSRTVALGVLATGSGNDFVKSLAKKHTLNSLLEAIQDSNNTLVDVGKAEFLTVDGQPTHRYFINIADVGIGGVIAEKLSRYQRWLGATFTYQRAILATFLSYTPQWLLVRTPAEEIATPMMSLVVANGKYFGSGLGIAPSALLNDGLLEVVMLKNITVIDYLRHLPTIRKCRPIHHPQVSYSSAKSIQIDTQKPLPIDMDGEFVGVTPVVFTVLKEAISVI